MTINKRGNQYVKSCVEKGEIHVHTRRNITLISYGSMSPIISCILKSLNLVRRSIHPPSVNYCKRNLSGAANFLNEVGYATDVEGNLNYWNQYVQASRVLERDRNKIIQLKNGCQFVYGGDVCDRGETVLLLFAKSQNANDWFFCSWCRAFHRTWRLASNVRINITKRALSW